MRRRIGFAPERWKAASNPLVQGLAFGLNIPACAAPILFGLMGAATVSGSAMTGFVMMAVFAFALSLPLLPLSIVPNLARPLDRLADWLRPRRWLLGAIFVGLGIWSVWFDLFVEPSNWSGT
jgi:cytochrome c-type biogenesis protein